MTSQDDSQEATTTFLWTIQQLLSVAASERSPTRSLAGLAGGGGVMNPNPGLLHAEIDVRGRVVLAHGLGPIATPCQPQRAILLNGVVEPNFVGSP